MILRGIFLKGVGLEMLWPDALALLAWGVGILDARDAAIEQAARVVGLEDQGLSR